MYYVNNILNYYHINPRKGKEWYVSEREFCQNLARETGYTFVQVAGIVAAGSINTKWARNKEFASAYCRGENPRHLKMVLNKCERIKTSSAYEIPDILNGAKVKCFYANLTGCDNAVTIDRWAYRAATGKDTKRVPAKEYPLIAQAYTLAANIAGIAPAVMQSIVWENIR